jgi:hypothetical protein
MHWPIAQILLYPHTKKQEQVEKHQSQVYSYIQSQLM